MGPDKRSPTVHGILNFENFWIIDLFTYNIYRKFYVSCYIILIFEEKNPIESSCFWSESVMLSYVICYHGYYSNFNGAANNNFIKSNDSMCTQRTICVESFHSYILKSIFANQVIRKHDGRRFRSILYMLYVISYLSCCGQSTSIIREKLTKSIYSRLDMGI